MPDKKPESGISCTIRCMQPSSIEDALQRLDPAGMERIPYTCHLSGNKEEVLLVGDQLASHLVEALPEIGDEGDMKILAGLYMAELCECDVATLTSLPENKVMQRLQSLTSQGVLGHRKLHGMNYYHLVSKVIRRKIETVIE